MPNFIKLDTIPVLPKRENNLQKFSTYLMLNNQNGRLALQWKHQASLQRNFKLYEQMHQEFSKFCYQEDRGATLAQFWQKVAIKEPQSKADWEPANKKQLAYEHLASYFEEKCYWTSKDLCKDRNVDSWEEYLFLARLLVSNPLKLSEILSKYNSQNGNLDTYITKILTNHIRCSAEVDRFSPWRLLYNKSDKELKEALKVVGLVEPEISQLIFARKYFKQVYLINKVKNPGRKTGQKWIDPDQKDFESIAQCYNAEKLLSSTPHEVSASNNVNAKQILDWMETCIAALKNYPKSIVPKFSLDALQSEGFEAKSKSEEVWENEWEGISNAEDTTESQEDLFKKANSVLSEQMQVIKPDYQKILFLYYGFGLNQKQLADKLQINQSTISRYLAKSTIKLLETLAKTSQPEQWVKQYVERWLKINYHAPVHSDLIQAALVSAIKKLGVEENEILQFYYGQHMDEIKIASHLGISLAEITAKLTQAINQLEEKLMGEINIWIKEYIEKWLRNYYQSLAKSILKAAPQSSSKKLDLEEQISLVIVYIQKKSQ